MHMITEGFATFICNKKNEITILNSLLSHLKYIGKDLSNVYLDEEISPNHIFQGQSIKRLQSLEEMEIFLTIEESYIICKRPNDIDDYCQKFKCEKTVEGVKRNANFLQEAFKGNTIILFENLEQEAYSEIIGSSIKYYVDIDNEQKELSSVIIKHKMYEYMLEHNVKMNVFVIFDKKRLLSIKYMKMDDISSYYKEELSLLFVGNKFFMPGQVNADISDIIDVLEED